nr:hypothetical protein [Tanacetum cinerariifolium]
MQTSLAGATQILSSGNTFSLAVGKYSSSGIFITGSGNDLSILFPTMYVLKFVNGVNSRTKMPIAVPVSTREPKCTVKQSVAKPFKETIASEYNHKPRNITRKLYERVSKACSW